MITQKSSQETPQESESEHSETAKQQRGRRNKSDHQTYSQRKKKREDTNRQ
jgi:hypothetical protein